MQVKPPATAAIDRLIGAAFADPPPRLDDGIVVDPSGRDPECAKIVSAFAGKDWRQIDRVKVLEFHSALPLLSASGFHHLLPAFMRHAIHSYYDLQDVIAATVSALTPPCGRRAREVFFDRASLFTPRQRQAVAAYLRGVAEADRLDWVPACEPGMAGRTTEAIRFWQGDEES